MMSLYEFLGKAAGTKLGKKVYLASLEGGWKHDIRKCLTLNIQEM